MKLTKMMIGLAALGVMAAGCGDSDNSCGDGGCPDGAVTPGDGGGGAGGAVGSITSGKYKATAATIAEDGCKIDPMVVVSMMVELPVDITAGTMKVGNPRGTPAMASLGQGPYVTTGGTFKLTRMNHVKLDAPSTCEYDSEVTSTITLDAIDSFGIGVVEKQSNRTTCMIPEGVGANCSSTWSWRMVKSGPL